MKHSNLLAITLLISATNLVAQQNDAPPVANDAPATTVAAPPTDALTANPTDASFDKTSYSLGLKTGEHYRKQGINLDPTSFVTGLNNGMKNETPKLTQEEITQVLTKLQETIIAQNKQQQQSLAAENLEKGKAFLEKNKANKDIVVLANGLQYQVLTSGKGDCPTLSDTVTVHYRGTLIDGTEFDSSYQRQQPASMPLANLIKGWQQALVMMKPGDKWKLFVPAELGYGTNGAGATIPPNATLIFEIELLSFSKAGAAATN